jgi:hypothetical protein
VDRATDQKELFPPVAPPIESNEHGRGQSDEGTG